MSSTPVAASARPLRADARRNREKVLEAARAAFAEHGMEAQMDDVARRAGVGVGTVYRHFPTKEALVEALVFHRFEQLADDARRRLADVEDPWEAFAGMLRAGAEAQAADRCLSEAFAAHPRIAELRRAAVEASGLSAAADELVERARAAGAVRPDLRGGDVPMIMCAMAAVTQGDAARDWRRYFEIVLAGLRPAAGGPLPR